MYVAVMQVEFALHGPTNLKERRRIVRSLKDRLRKHFEVAVAEVGPVENYREATFGISLVSNDAKYARSRADKIMDFLESNPQAEVTDSQVEIL